MSLSLLWSNFVAYSLQIGLLVGVAAFAPTLLRLRSPRARLAYWHLLLLACLVLPLIRPWRQQVIADTVTVSTRVVAAVPQSVPAPRGYSGPEIALAVIVLGAFARLVWLAVGVWKLGRYRRRSEPFRAPLPWPSRAELRIARDAASPVTFGARDPVILLPPQFPALDPLAQQAILCHELLHVERHDWLFTMAEEIVRAVFWFHPAIWWLLGEIQLAREQAVDREVIELTNAKDEYVDALLAIAGAKPQLDLAPAPLFLRKRHLKHRVVSILKEARMSRTRLLSALAGSLCILVAACWLVTHTFPLAAAPQVVSDAPGVTVDVAGAMLLHRAPVAYPESTRAKRIQGAVVVELTFDAVGNVSDARVLSGPDELRKPVLQSVLHWHFARESAGSRRQVTIDFALPAGGQPEPARVGRRETLSVVAPPDAQGLARALREAEQSLKADATPANRSRVAELQKSYDQQLARMLPPRTIKSINVVGVSEDVRRELLSRLSGRVGTQLTPETIAAMADIVTQLDEHLQMPIVPVSATEAIVTIVPATANPEPRAAMAPSVALSSSVTPLRVGGSEQSAKLIRQPRPVYPAEAKAARIQGAVRLAATIAADGTIRNLEVISGHPLLVPAALDAVRNWVYSPTLLNGNPVDVQTMIDINFTLSQ